MSFHSHRAEVQKTIKRAISNAKILIASIKQTQQCDHSKNWSQCKVH